MDLQHVLFSPEGRIGRQDFWLGWLILFAAGWALHFIPLLGTVIWLVSIYCWVVLYAKRLHDFGKSGWWSLVPIVANFVGLALLITAVVAAIVGVAASSVQSGGGDVDWRVLGPALGGVLGVLWVVGLLAAVHLVFLLWVGLSHGDPGVNHYGPPPASSVPPPFPPVVTAPAPPASGPAPPGVTP